MVTGDKDFIQIVDEDVRLFDPMKDVHTGPAEVKEKLGIEPRQMRDYLALVGDAVDNVPKVPGIGPKTATELIQQFGDVDTLLARLDEVKKPKIREALAAHRDTLLMARQLVTFKTDLDLKVTIPELARRPIDMDRARKLFTELEFYRLINELPADTAAAPKPAEAPAPAVAAAPAVLVTTEAELKSFVDAARAAGSLFLVPAYEGPPFTAPLVGLGLALLDGRTAYVPLRHQQLGTRQVPEAAFVSGVRGLLEDAVVKKGGHDLKALALVLAGAGADAARGP